MANDPPPEVDVHEAKHAEGGVGQHDEPGFDVDVGGLPAPVPPPLQGKPQANAAPHRVGRILLGHGAPGAPGAPGVPATHLREHHRARPGEQADQNKARARQHVNLFEE